MSYLRPILPAFALISILWTVWDPTYSAFRLAQIQGRDVRVQGKQSYIVSALHDIFVNMLIAIRLFKCYPGFRDYSLPLSSLCIALGLTRIIYIYHIIRLRLEVVFTFLHRLSLSYS